MQIAPSTKIPGDQTQPKISFVGQFLTEDETWVRHLQHLFPAATVGLQPMQQTPGTGCRSQVLDLHCHLRFWNTISCFGNQAMGTRYQATGMISSNGAQWERLCAVQGQVFFGTTEQSEIRGISLICGLSEDPSTGPKKPPN